MLKITVRWLESLKLEKYSEDNVFPINYTNPKLLSNLQYLYNSRREREKEQ